MERDVDALMDWGSTWCIKFNAKINFMNQGFCPVNIYLDLSKAFDCLKYDYFTFKIKILWDTK